MTNFDYYKKEKDFESFIDIAIVAEKSYQMDTNTCILNCRRAMEMAIKWMYSIDMELHMPYKDSLGTLMYDDTFRAILTDDIWNRLEFIRKEGNLAAHNEKPKSKNEAKLCLYNLFCFVDFLYYTYSYDYEERKYDASLLEQETKEKIDVQISDIDLKQLIEPIKNNYQTLSYIIYLLNKPQRNDKVKQAKYAKQHKKDISFIDQKFTKDGILKQNQDTLSKIRNFNK